MEITTKQEQNRPAVGMVRLLTQVLSYDDLLASPAAVYPLDRTASYLLIGRAVNGRPAGLQTGGELRLDDAWLSGRHALLTRQGDSDWLADTGSANGTFVNGQRITRKALHDFDLIEAGHSLLCYRVVPGPLYEALSGPEDALHFGPTRTFCPEVALLLRSLRHIAPSREPVLILGETGAGKEFAAATIHRLSGRPGPYVAVDCGAVPEGLFESTFFGHQRGAFTGATAPHKGEILRARGGTLFLDEVANMSPAAQAKLLRVLEDGKVTPLGASAPQTADVRWLAATNRDLLQPGDPPEGPPFRPDLLRRLAGFAARLPPLRRRREDLGVLSAHLLREAGFHKVSITASAGRSLFCGAFPGNIRQLRTALRSAALLAGGQPIDDQHLQPAGPVIPGPGPGPRPGPQPSAPPPEGPPPGPPAQRQAPGPPPPAEIEAVLVATGGNVVHAARLLKTHPRQLYRWLERFSISIGKFRR